MIQQLAPISSKLVSILSKILIKQTKPFFTKKICLFFKQIAYEEGLMQILCYSKINPHEIQIEDIEQYKEKYNDYEKIQAFQGHSQPQIKYLSTNNGLVLYRGQAHHQLYSVNIDDTIPKLVRKASNTLTFKLYVDNFVEDQFFLIVNRKLEMYRIVKNEAKRVFRMEIDAQYEYDVLSRYSQDLIISMSFKPPIITFHNIKTKTSKTIDTINISRESQIYFYPEFQRSNKVYLFIQQEDKSLQIHQAYQLELIDNLNFELNVEEIKQMSIQKINTIFLLDLVQQLPNIKELCQWQVNDYEAVKYLLTENLLSMKYVKIITISIIYCLKYEPIHVIGIIKYLDLFCFFTQQQIQPIMQKVYQVLPGYRTLRKKNIIQGYLDYASQYIKITEYDEELVWNLIKSLI
ncbi:hypothetical protein pb186bvf_002693 [Paramecium bursaria]